MKNRKKITIAYRRKREGRTNYKKRLALLSGHLPRIIVRITNKRIIAQVAEYAPEGDKIICTVTSAELKKFGWQFSLSNLPAAYLTGVLVAHKAKKLKINKAILDIGFHTSIKGSRIYGVLKGAIDAKLDIPADESAFPKMDRIKGEHIKKYALQSAESPLQFAHYKKDSLPISSLDKQFEEVKTKILRE
jgi:large subunit ribosomal protein L18